MSEMEPCSRCGQVKDITRFCTCVSQDEIHAWNAWHEGVDAAQLDRRIADVAVAFIGRMSSEQVRKKFTQAAARVGMDTFELAYALAEKSDPR